MHTTISCRRIAATLLTVVLAVGAGTAVAGEFAKGFPGESPLIIPAAAFAPDPDAPTEYAYNTNGYISGASSTACMVAPVYLPDGATVTQLVASIVDMADTNMTVSLVRTNNSSYRSTSAMASVTSNGNTYPTVLTNFYFTGSIINAVVDYPEYSYYVQACLADWHFQLYQVEIEYSESVIFKDGFESGNTNAWSSAARKSAVIDGLVVDATSPADPPSVEDVVPGTTKSVPYTSPLTIAPSEFKPNGPQAGEVLIGFIDGVMYGGNYSGTRYMHAPVYLPDGATITEVTARVMDNDAGGGGVSNCDSGTPSQIGLYMYRSKGCSGASCYDEMGTAETTGASTIIQFLDLPSIANPVVDADNYGYHLMIRLCGPKHEVYAVRITYTEP